MTFNDPGKLKELAPGRPGPGLISPLPFLNEFADEFFEELQRFDDGELAPGSA